MVGKEKLEKIGKEADLVIEHKKGDKGRPTGSKGALPVIKTMAKADLMREVGSNRKKLKELESKLIELDKAGGPPEDQIPPEMWAVFPALVYDYMSTRFGSHWKLNEAEVLLYGQTLQRVADRYLGTVVGDNPELFSLAIVAVSLTVPRVVMTVKQRGEDAVSRKEADRNNNRPGPKGVGEEFVGPESPS